MASQHESFTVAAAPADVVVALRAQLLGTEHARRSARPAGQTFVDGAIDPSSFRLRLMNHTVRGTAGVCSGTIEPRDGGGTMIHFDSADLGSAWIVLVGGLAFAVLVIVAQWPEIIGEGEGYFMAGKWPLMLTMMVGVTSVAAVVRGSAARQANDILRRRVREVLSESTSRAHAPSA